MQKVCNSEDGGLNDALKLARRVENDGVVASAALELSGSWATTATTESAYSCKCAISVSLHAGGACGVASRKVPIDFACETSRTHNSNLHVCTVPSLFTPRTFGYSHPRPRHI